MVSPHTAKDAREKFKLNMAKDDNTSTGSMGTASPEMPFQPLDGNVSATLAEDNETNMESMEVVEAAPAAGIVNATPLPSSPSSGVVTNTLPVTAATGIESVRRVWLHNIASAAALTSPLASIGTQHAISAGIVNTTPLPSPSSGVVTNTLPVTAATGIESVQSPSLVNITALTSPLASIGTQHAISGTPIPIPTPVPQLYQQPLQLTAVPLPLLQPPLQSIPPEMSIPPFVLDKPINQEWDGMNGYAYGPTIGGPGYDFGLQTLGGDFGGQTGLGPFNMLNNAWHVAQDPAGNPGIGMDDPMDWNLGVCSSRR
jgi:hypothetical protein